MNRAEQARLDIKLAQARIADRAYRMDLDTNKTLVINDRDELEALQHCLGRYDEENHYRSVMNATRNGWLSEENDLLLARIEDLESIIALQKKLLDQRNEQPNQKVD